MKRYIFALLFAVSFGASADVTVNLNEVRFIDLVRIAYGEIGSRSYVLDADAVKAESLVSLNLRKVEARVVLDQVRRLAVGLGLSIDDDGRVVRIGKLIEEVEQKEILVYRPQYRSVSYLLDLVTAFFPKEGFSGMRQVQQQGQNQAYWGQQAQQGQQAQFNGLQRGGQQQIPQGTETGTNAYGMLSKNDLDVIVFNGSDRDRKRLASVLAELDQPAGELQIKALVYEVRTTAQDGNALKLAASLFAGKFGFSLDQGEKSHGVLKLSLGGDKLDAVLSALASDSRFKLMSAPRVRVKSGGNARFVAGSDVPVLGNVSYQQTGSAVQSVDYKTSGVILDIKPHVRELVNELQITQQISSFVPTTSGVNNTPTLLKRELSTQVNARDGELIAVGGLEETTKTDEETGFSFLPRWMRTSSSDQGRTEIMVLIDAQRI